MRKKGLSVAAVFASVLLLPTLQGCGKKSAAVSQDTVSVEVVTDVSREAEDNVQASGEDVQADGTTEYAQTADAAEDGQGAAAEKSPYNPDTGAVAFTPEESWESISAKLQEIYDSATEDEENSIDLLVYEYIQYQIGNVDQERYAEFSEMLDDAEEVYQQINEWDPNLKGVLTDEAVYLSGASSPLGQYTVGTMADLYLGNDEVGQALRRGTAEIGYWLMQSLLRGTAEADDVDVVYADENYALIRNNGTVYELFELLKKRAGYEDALDYLDDRRYSMDHNNFDLYWNTTLGLFEDQYYSCSSQEELDSKYTDWADRMNRLARVNVIADKRTEWLQAESDFETAFIEDLGLDRETIIEKYDAQLLAELQSDDPEEQEYALEELYESRSRRIEEEYGPSEEYQQTFVVGGTYETEEEAEAAKEEYLRQCDEEVQERQRELYEDVFRRVVGNSYIYTVIDNQNNLLYSFLLEDRNPTAAFSEDGICSLNDLSGQSMQGASHVVLDAEGKILFQSGSEKDGTGLVYFNPSSYGTILRKSYGDSFEQGATEIIEFVDASGESKVILQDTEVSLSAPETKLDAYFGDYYYYSGSDNSGTSAEGYISMKDGSLLTVEEYQKLMGTYEDESSEAAEWQWEDNTTPEAVQHGRWIDENKTYILYKDGIYDSEGTLLKQVTEGQGIDSVTYGDGYFYIISKSGYYYALDSDFNQTVEPVNLKEERIIDSELTDLGIILCEEVQDSETQSMREVYVLYNGEGEAIYTSERYISDNSRQGFVFGSIAGEMYLNLNTKEEIFFGIAESGIGTDLI